MRFLLILLLVITKPCFGQIKLGIKVKRISESEVKVEILDSSRYVPFFEEFQPTKFDLSFVNDTVQSYKFHYQVFGHVVVPSEPLIENIQCELVITGKTFFLQLDYTNSYYGNIFYSINGILSHADKLGYQKLTPSGTCIVRNNAEVFIYNILGKKILTEKFILEE